VRITVRRGGRDHACPEPYITDRFPARPAIDLMDEAARLKMHVRLQAGELDRFGPGNHPPQDLAGSAEEGNDARLQSRLKALEKELAS